MKIGRKASSWRSSIRPSRTSSRLAVKLEARTERRISGGREIFLKPVIKGAPVIHGADEALKGLTGFLDGPGGMALERVGLVAGLALAALGVGLQQVNEIVGIFALGFDDQRLRDCRGRRHHGRKDCAP